MKDILVRSIAKQAGVRAVMAVTTELSNEAARRHKSTPTATTALSRSLSAAALAGTLLKVKQRIALKFEGDGPLQKLISESDAYGRVRGYVESPKVEVERDDLGCIDVPAALGKGILHVSKDVGRGQLIEGIVDLTSSQIGEDFSTYLNQSEQLLSTVQIGVKLDEDGTVLYAGGIMLQSFGDEGKDTLSTLSERLEELPPVVDMLADGTDAIAVLDAVFGDVEHDVLEERDLSFHCSCSSQRSEKAIRMLDRVELEGLIEEGSAVVTCHFCHEEYVFGRDDLRLFLIDSEDGV